MGRSFAVGLGVVLLVAAIGVVLLRPAGEPAPKPVVAAGLDMTGVHTTQRAPASARPPPNREDLLAVLCSGDVVRTRCEHELITIYRACGIDLAHPRTAGCGAAFARVRRAPD